MISSYRTAGRGTPDGTRTHRKAHFECVVYANSTTGAYCGSFYELPIFGALAGTRTPNLPIKSRLLCQLSYKHLLRVYHIVLGNAD